VIKPDDADRPRASSLAETFLLPLRELVGNLDRLFVFVEQPAVEPTNNRSQRNVRGDAEICTGARTSTTASRRHLPSSPAARK